MKKPIIIRHIFRPYKNIPIILWDINMRRFCIDECRKNKSEYGVIYNLFSEFLKHLETKQTKSVFLKLSFSFKKCQRAFILVCNVYY